MSKLCDIYWRQRVMGHWQYILYVNTILFVLHCIISLCSFMIPVRIQSFFFFFFGNFWSAEDFIWTMCFSLKKKRKKEKPPLSSPLWWGACTEAVWDAVCLQEDHRLWIWLNIRISPRQTCGRRRGGSKVAPRPKPPTTQPLTDCSLFWSSFRWITVTLHHE